jgi:hypothetical protein
MTKPNGKKKRSNKFPLTLHSTGQYCKKIRGKLYYFGTDKRKALERYLKEATDLHSGRTTPLRRSQSHQVIAPYPAGRLVSDLC